MKSTPINPDWPDYLPGPTDHLRALGVITLMYGYLEGIYQTLFSEATGMTPAQVGALFQRVPNNIRADIMHELLEKTSIPINIKELVRHFSLGFNACAENRHSLMHSRSGGIISDQKHSHHGFVFTKYSRKGNVLVCTPSLSELMAVADSMQEYALFAAWLGMAINSATLNKMSEESTWLPPSLQKPPPLPASLIWRTEADFESSLVRS